MPRLLDRALEKLAEVGGGAKPKIAEVASRVLVGHLFKAFGSSRGLR